MTHTMFGQMVSALFLRPRDGFDGNQMHVVSQPGTHSGITVRFGRIGLTLTVEEARDLENALLEHIQAHDEAAPGDVQSTAVGGAV